MLEVRQIVPGSVEVTGCVDLASVFELREKLATAVDRALAEGVPILSVDLHALRMLDPDGLGVLLGAHRRAQRGGCRLRLVRLDPELWQLLLISRLYRVLDVAPEAMTPAAAAAAAPAPAPARPADPTVSSAVPDPRPRHGSGAAARLSSGRRR